MQIDSIELEAVVRRLQRAQGQIGGIVQMIQEERNCQDIITQLAAVSKAIDRAGFAVISVGLQQCISASPDGQANTSELEKLFLSLA